MNKTNLDVIMFFSDIELLRYYNRVASKVIELKNDELIFLAEHPNCEFLSDEHDKEYAELINDIDFYENEFYTLQRIVEKR